MASSSEPSSSVQSLLSYVECFDEKEMLDFAYGLGNKVDPTKLKSISSYWLKIRAIKLKANAIQVNSLKDVTGELAPPPKKAKWENSRSAWKVPFILRGDLIPDDGKLFLDVEKVDLKMKKRDTVHKKVAATVALVDKDGNLVFWAFIKHKKKDVCQYFTSLTRLTRGSLEDGISMSMLRKIMFMCLDGNTLVGFAVKQDLESMDYGHDSIIDLQKFYVDPKGQPYNLKLLAQTFLEGKEIQTGQHSAITDARVTLALYNEMLRLKATKPAHDIQAFEINRPEKAKFKHTGERCKCK